MPGKILCPIDFSQASHDVLGVAARIAIAHDAELVVAHAWHFPTVASANETSLPGKTLQLLLADEQHALEKAAVHARELGVERVSTRFLDGAPWQRMVETAAEDRAFDLIVMGSQGRTGIKRFVLGSVAENVVRHSPISVLVVRGTPDGPRFDHVLCPVDFSEGSQAAIDRASEMTNPGRTLELLHVIDLPLAAAGDPMLADFISDLDARATAELERYRPKQARAEVLTGNPAEQILAKLDEDRTFDLVAVATHGRTGLRRMLLGSVAEKLVRHAPCSVLVVRTRA